MFHPVLLLEGWGGGWPGLTSVYEIPRSPLQANHGFSGLRKDSNSYVYLGIYTNVCTYRVWYMSSAFIWRGRYRVDDSEWLVDKILHGCL